METVDTPAVIAAKERAKELVDQILSLEETVWEMRIEGYSSEELDEFEAKIQPLNWELIDLDEIIHPQGHIF